MGNLAEASLAAVLVVAVAWINIRGVRWGGVVQVATTAVKVAFLCVIIALPLALLPWGSHFSVANWTASFGAALADPSPGTVTASLASRFGVVLLAVMWAYNGWHGVNQVAEEIKSPERKLPQALFAGIGLIVLLYLAHNLAVHGVLPLDQVAKAGEEATAEMLRVVIGPAGAVAIAVVLVIGTFGTIVCDLLIAPRISFAMGRDGVFFRQLAEVHPRYHTPAVAIAIQAVMAIVLVIGSACWSSSTRASRTIRCSIF